MGQPGKPAQKNKRKNLKFSEDELVISLIYQMERDPRTRVQLPGLQVILRRLEMNQRRRKSTEGES